MEIQGYPDYLIYPDGRIWAKKTKGRREGYLKTAKTKQGYLQLQLYHKNKKKNFLVHRLIAIHYIPNPLNLPFVDHIDRDKTNNNIYNLRWVTRSENNQNTTSRKNNKCGIKNISYCKTRNVWRYQKRINNLLYSFSDKNKNICLWVKFYDHILTN